jgi:hypothetical protein
MRFKVNRRSAASCAWRVPRPARTEGSQALCSVIENRVVQFDRTDPVGRLPLHVPQPVEDVTSIGLRPASRSSLVTTKVPPAEHAA